MKEEGEAVYGEDDAETPACAGDRGPAPEDDDLTSLQDVEGPWAAGSAGGVKVALNMMVAAGASPASGQAALPPGVDGNAIQWAGTPLEVTLQPADDAQPDAADEVDIAPRQLQLTPDSIGEDYGAVHLVNQSAEEQVVIVSADLPEGVALYLTQDEPQSARLTVAVDAARAAPGQDAVGGAVLYIATASGTTTVQVTQSPAPFSSYGGQSGAGL